MNLADNRIKDIVRKAVTANLHSTSLLTNVGSIITTTVLDSSGNEAVRITIGLTAEPVENISGDSVVKVLETISAIQNEFSKADDDRLPLVEFSDEASLAEAGS